MNPSEEHLDLVSDPFDDTPKPASETSAAAKESSEPFPDASPGGDLLRVELEEAKNHALRARAELENYRNRMHRVMESERKYANVDLLRDLLGVGDNIGRALDAAEKTHNIESLIEGVKLVYEQFYQVLETYHCERIAALHQPFDPNYHESIALLPDDRFAPNTVIEETQSGFRLHDRVIRPAQVVLAAATGPKHT